MKETGIDQASAMRIKDYGNKKFNQRHDKGVLFSSSPSILIAPTSVEEFHQIVFRFDSRSSAFTRMSSIEDRLAPGWETQEVESMWLR